LRAFLNGDIPHTPIVAALLASDLIKSGRTYDIDGDPAGNKSSALAEV
jgi:hypothetical protein